MDNQGSIKDNISLVFTIFRRNGFGFSFFIWHVLHGDIDQVLTTMAVSFSFSKTYNNTNGFDTIIFIFYGGDFTL